MSRYLLLAFSFLGSTVAFGQLLPNSSQTFQLAPLYNPAFTGTDNFTSVKIGYRSQWASFPGAPRYFNLAAHGRIGKPVDMTHNALKVGTTINKDDIPKLKRMIHGLGSTFVDESSGMNNMFEIMEGGVTYAAHYPLTKKMYLAGGVSVHYGSIRVRWEELQLGSEQDKLVEALRGSSLSNMNVRTGLLLYTPRFYVHAAYLKTYVNNNTGLLSSDLRYRYRMSGGIGVRFDLSQATELAPSVGLLMDDFNNMSFDYSLKLYLRNRAWGGFSYRDNGFASLLLGFELNSLVGLSYSYEISTGGLSGFNNGSNEVIVGLKLANLRRVNQYVW